MTDQMDGAVNGRFIDARYGRVESASTPPTVHYVNEAGLAEDELEILRNNLEIASQIERWTQSINSDSMDMPSVDMFNRNRWGKGSKHPFAQMSQCAWAVENDDILSTLAEVIEGLSYGKCRFELFDEDQQDLWNQWAADVNLDALLRATGRELFKCSQVYVGMWWATKTYAVRDKPIADTLADLEKQQAQKTFDEWETNQPIDPMTGVVELPPPNPAEQNGSRRGNRRRKKKFTVKVPTELTVFDPTKILPVGTLMFGRERFAYIATEPEDHAFGEVVEGRVPDPTVNQLIEKKYQPTEQDRRIMAELGMQADYGRLWLLREEAVFRHTLTRADYERFAQVRLSSILPILEMKAHLRASDRAMLIGNTNFIVVITKGTDKLPAKQAEIENLKEQSRIIARLPVLVGDHRLHVEIISPAMDNTLIESRWQVLDSRLVFKALQSFQPIVQGGNAASGVSEMSRVVSKGLENRRHMQTRSFEAKVFNKIVEMNADELDERPALAYTPKHITLDFKADVMNAILKVRDRGDISRETMLEELDFDQENEALRRGREKVLYDPVFTSSVPFGSPATNPFAAGKPPAPGQPAGIGPAGQPKEGGRPAGVVDDQPRAKAKTKEAAALEHASESAED